MGRRPTRLWAATRVLIFWCASALPRGSWHRRLPEAASTSSGGDLYFEQRLDHFDRTNAATFFQRYFVNGTYHEKGGPVFLCVGGEGPALDASVLYRSVHCSDATELAASASALLVALEHRYYGKSVPRNKAGLEHLSSQQAVADISTFHAHVTRSMNLTRETKWVAFGGSYPGMVAGFARLKLPHLIHAAVSSSAPWRAQLDMREYNDIVADSLAMPAVGGSERCAQRVADGHAALKSLLDNDDDDPASHGRVAALFDLCDASELADERRRKRWAGSGVVDVPSQENDPAKAGDLTVNIEAICAALLDDGASANETDLEALARVAQAQRGGGCLRLPQADPAQALQADVFGDARSWPWQTCTEFAFYQTCEADSRCPFARGYVTLDDEISMCMQLFGIDVHAVGRHVAFTNGWYGGSAPRGSRILFPNGDVDPWSGLGVLDSPDLRLEPTLLVKGASHHAWTHPADTIVQPTVREAKGHIQRQVLAWLDEDVVVVVV